MSYVIVGFICMSLGAGIGMLIAALMFAAGHADDCETCRRNCKEGNNDDNRKL